MKGRPVGQGAGFPPNRQCLFHLFFQDHLSQVGSNLGGTKGDGSKMRMLVSHLLKVQSWTCCRQEWGQISPVAGLCQEPVEPVILVPCTATLGLATLDSKESEPLSLTPPQWPPAPGHGAWSTSLCRTLNTLSYPLETSSLRFPFPSSQELFSLLTPGTDGTALLCF